MVIVELFSEIKVYGGLVLNKGHRYIMADAVMNQLLKMYPGIVEKIGDFNSVYTKFSPKTAKQGDTVFLFRSGGIGDVMFLLPLVKHLHEKYGMRVKVGTSPSYCSVLEGNPHINKIVKMPFNIEEVEDSDCQLMFEGVIEGGSQESKVYHAVDLFLNEAGIDFNSIRSKDKIPEIFLNEGEKTVVLNKIKKLGIGNRKRIGIQLEASSPVRSYPIDKMIALIRKLLDHEYAVFLFGGKNQVEMSKYIEEVMISYSGFVSLVSATRELRESIIYSSFMDLFIAPDSAFIHIAGSFRIPVIGLYGCFPSMLRMKYYENSIGIDCNVACAPSFIHGHAPCPKGVPSPCFSVISVNDIMNAVNQVFGVKKINLVYPTYNTFIDGEFVHTPFSVFGDYKNEKKSN